MGEMSAVAGQHRRNAVAAFLLAAMIGCVFVVVRPTHSVRIAAAEKAVTASTRNGNQKLALKTAGSLAPKDSHLALELIRAAPTQSLEAMQKMIVHWQDRMVSSDDNDASHGAMLASVPRSITQALQATERLCAKKDMIFDKFDKLLNKMGAESFDRNQTDAASEMSKDETMKAWLDAESQYRLQMEKLKEAQEGAKFARDRYEKWSETVKETQARVDKMEKTYAEEGQAISDQRMLIKEIQRLLGIIGDQPLDDVTAAAGGYVAAKKAPSPLKLAQIRAKLAELKKQAARDGPGQGISLQQVDMLQSKLANFAESDEVNELLGNMLKDLDQRDEVIKKALADSKAELEDHKKMLVEYEKELVDLQNAADAAQMKATNQNLLRQKLNGEKTNAAEAYEQEHAEYVVVAPPADRTIYVLKVIMAKINEYCAHGTISTVAGR